LYGPRRAGKEVGQGKGEGWVRPVTCVNKRVASGNALLGRSPTDDWTAPSHPRVQSACADTEPLHPPLSLQAEALAAAAQPRLQQRSSLATEVQVTASGSTAPGSVRRGPLRCSVTLLSFGSTVPHCSSTVGCACAAVVAHAESMTTTFQAPCDCDRDCALSLQSPFYRS